MWKTFCKTCLGIIWFQNLLFTVLSSNITNGYVSGSFLTASTTSFYFLFARYGSLYPAFSFISILLLSSSLCWSIPFSPIFSINITKMEWKLHLGSSEQDKIIIHLQSCQLCQGSPSVHRIHLFLSRSSLLHAGNPCWC